ncbi:MAG: group 1 truncated hemoglobin [Chitinophagaceae bacterium]|uniref:group 1 truncated hemoglobin n=1 Tax=unclassified Paraflavitalea TaxID=2798305 RepID=UPI003D349D03|nr:group 1 truncated hemoglobin [Chitinophagaceae bacterium]
MKKTTILAMAVGLFVSAMSFTSCDKNNDNTMTVKPTLYDSLGGTTMVADPRNSGVMIEKGRLGIRSVVDSTIFVIAADSKLNSYFQPLLAEVTAGNTSGLTALSKSLTDFFCVATGAKNFTYGGKNMVAAHDPAQNPRMNGKSDNAAFDQFIADLVVGANQNKLPANLINSVGALVNTLRSQVVQR